MEYEYYEKIEYTVKQTNLRFNLTEKFSFHIPIKKIKNLLLSDNDEKNRSI